MEVYLTNMLDRSKKLQALHNNCFNYYNKRNLIIVITNLGITGITGTITLMTSEIQNNFNINIVLGITLYLNSLLIGLGKLLDYHTLSIKHKTIHKKYMTLQNYVEKQLTNPENEELIHSFISNILTEISEDLPIIPNSLNC